MHSTHLALASQTQFVEFVIKEAKLAASTDQSEQVRSCIAIIFWVRLTKMQMQTRSRQWLIRPWNDPQLAATGTGIKSACNMMLNLIKLSAHFRNKVISNKTELMRKKQE